VTEFDNLINRQDIQEQANLKAWIGKQGAPDADWLPTLWHS
jgi:hypothetical protein